MTNPDRECTALGIRATRLISASCCPHPLQLSFRSLSTLDDDGCEYGCDENEMGLIAEPEDPVPLMSRLEQMALRLTMICVSYGVLNPNHLVGRLSREH